MNKPSLDKFIFAHVHWESSTGVKWFCSLHSDWLQYNTHVQIIQFKKRKKKYTHMIKHVSVCCSHTANSHLSQLQTGSSHFSYTELIKAPPGTRTAVNTREEPRNSTGGLNESSNMQMMPWFCLNVTLPYVGRSRRWCEWNTTSRLHGDESVCVCVCTVLISAFNHIYMQIQTFRYASSCLCASGAAYNEACAGFLV